MDRTFGKTKRLISFISQNQYQKVKESYEEKNYSPYS